MSLDQFDFFRVWSKIIQVYYFVHFAISSRYLIKCYCITLTGLIDSNRKNIIYEIHLFMLLCVLSGNINWYLFIRTKCVSNVSLIKKPTFVSLSRKTPNNLYKINKTKCDIIFLIAISCFK